MLERSLRRSHAVGHPQKYINEHVRIYSGSLARSIIFAVVTGRSRHIRVGRGPEGPTGSRTVLSASRSPPSSAEARTHRRTRSGRIAQRDATDQDGCDTIEVVSLEEIGFRPRGLANGQDRHDSRIEAKRDTAARSRSTIHIDVPVTLQTCLTSFLFYSLQIL